MAFLRPGYRDQKSQHGKLFACRANPYGGLG